MSDASRPPRGGILASLVGRQVHVVGASGAEGAALLLHLAREGGAMTLVGHDFAEDPRGFARSFRRANTAWDRTRREELLSELRRLPIELRLGADYLREIEDADFILASQNWFNYPSNSPAIPRALERGAELFGLADLALDLFEGVRIGITGSNGKSTTSALVRHLLTHSTGPNQRVLQGGNDRDRQVSLSEVEGGTLADFLVWEVSNRHLRDRAPAVDVAVITNITRNHIEDHGSFEAYVQAKLRLTEGALPGGQVILSALDPESRRWTQKLRTARATLWRFGAAPPPGYGLDGLVWIDDEDNVLLRRPRADQVHVVGDARKLSMIGRHNRLNLLAAVAASVAAGADPERLGPAFSTFDGLAGRLETVAVRDGVAWIYDIQATTAPAAAAGIRAVGDEGRRVVLVVGGEDKGMDYTGMAEAAAAHCEAILALPGTGTEAFLAVLGDRVPIERFDDLDTSLEWARQTAPVGSAVLLSPGCAFFHSRYVNSGPSFARRVEAVLA